jgi:hypothetical protein
LGFAEPKTFLSNLFSFRTSRSKDSYSGNIQIHPYQHLHNRQIITYEENVLVIIIMLFKSSIKSSTTFNLITSEINERLTACGRPAIKHTFDVWHFAKVFFKCSVWTSDFLVL